MDDVKRFLPQKTPIGTVMKGSREGYWIQAVDFDAQRLRADTAEAELKTVRESHELMRADLISTDAKLAAAEQRIAQTVLKLELAASMLDDDERGNRFAQVLQLAIAALNPKPEAGSHEKH